MTRRSRMSGVDRAWLRMDRPGNPMTITGVLLLSGRVSLKAVRRLIRERLLRFSRFRSRPVDGVTGGYWVEDTEFSLNRHVVRRRLPRPAGKAALRKLIGRLAGETLPPEHPRWRFDLVENAPGGTALVMRIHHCYADGLALVRLVLSMADSAAAGGPRAEPGLIGGAWQLARDGLVLSRDLLLHPSHSWQLTESAVDYAGELGRLGLLEPDPVAPFHRALSGRKQVAWSEGLDLEAVKQVGRVLDGSVNDVLLACAAGALGQHLRSRGGETDAPRMRAVVPVNLRPTDRPASDLGNYFGLILLSLPVAETDPLVRLRQVHAETLALRRSKQPALAFGLLEVLGLAPQALEPAVVDLLSDKASAVMTNVPGPREALSFAGHRLRRPIFWVPQSGHIGLGISILSYDGRIEFGVIADRSVMAAPDALVRRFEREFDTLQWMALMRPWPAHG